MQRIGRFADAVKSTMARTLRQAIRTTRPDSGIFRSFESRVLLILKASMVVQMQMAGRLQVRCRSVKTKVHWQLR
jgi:hypothetical protein